MTARRSRSAESLRHLGGLVAVAAMFLALVPAIAGAQESGLRIEGTVTLEDGTPVSDLWVMGYRDGDTWLGSIWDVTDEDGRYVLDGAEADTEYIIHFVPLEVNLVRVWAAHDDNGEWSTTTRRETATPIVLDDAHPVEVVDVVLVEGGTVKGTITNEGEPVAGASVALWRDNDRWVPNKETTTDNDGYFEIPGVVPRDHAEDDFNFRLRYRLPEDLGTDPFWYPAPPTPRPASPPFSVPPGEDLELDLDLNPLPPPPPPPPPPPGGKDAVSVGDPHLKTFDGLGYDFHAEGEFWLVRSTVDDFAIQVRGLQGPTGRVAWNDAVGIRTPGGHEVVVTTQTVADGTPVISETVLDDGTVVDRQSVLLTDGTRVILSGVPSARGVNINIAEDRFGAVEGLLGDGDDDVTNDGALPGGEVVFGPGDLAGEAGFEILYDTYGPEWEVADAERLFDEERRTYRVPGSFPPKQFPPEAIEAATEACLEAGFEIEPGLTWCSFDVLAADAEPNAEDAQLVADIEIVADAGNLPVVEPFEAGRLALGNAHSCVLTDVGGVQCWGANNNGRLGDGTTTNRSTPVDVVGLTSGVVAITAGADHTCAITEESALLCWGLNNEGQLGDGTITQRLTPTAVSGLGSGVLAVDGGTAHTCAVVAGGTAKCWGNGGNYRLGDGTPTQRRTPVDVVGLTGVTAITAGGSHTCAIANGGAKCWGQTLNGRLGNGQVTDGVATAPVDVTGLTSGVTAIETKFAHTCAIVNGAARCWGNGTSGRLGYGGTNQQGTSVQVSGLTSGVTAIGVGSNHSCAIVDGVAKCWGANVNGQLGDGTNLQRTTPVDVVDLGAGVSEIRAGNGHTCAVVAEGIQCWGLNTSGKLGNGTAVTHSLVPVWVVGYGGLPPEDEE